MNDGRTAPFDRSAGTSLITSQRMFAVAAFAAGLGTPFTFNLVGEMPVGEVILFFITFYGLCYILMERRWPVGLLAGRSFQLFMVCQFIAFCGYVMSDLYRGSDPHDFVRGWARMLFLAVDLFATTYLFGVSSVNFVLMGGVGVAIGRCISTVVVGPLFGDYWKFGYGAPLTLLLVVAVSRIDPSLTAMSLVAMGCLHAVLGFRSLGAECFLLAVALVAMRFPVRIRFLALIVLGVAGLIAGGLFYLHQQTAEEGARSTRSDVERKAMMTAAWDGFAESPLIGQGSWFSKSNVMAHFQELRTEWAAEARVGGFVADGESETIAVHSQILVSLAEGGIVGGVFFIFFGLNILWAIGYCIFSRKLDSVSAIYLFVLLTSFSNLLFSPFSGAHREGIAVAAAVITVCWQQWGEARQARAAESPHLRLMPQWRRQRKTAMALGIGPG